MMAITSPHGSVLGASSRVGDGAGNVTCLSQMPWFESVDALASQMRLVRGSDKVTSHQYQHMYFNVLAPLARSRCLGRMAKDRVVRILEIGLGCGDKVLAPGASAAIWRRLFPPGHLTLDLHMLEYDEACVKKWAASRLHLHPNLKLHTGDQSSLEVLNRVYREAGSQQFDVIIDDGSHVNEHQLKTSVHLLTRQRLSAGGSYVIEDIHASCADWALPGQVTSDSHVRVGGTPGCMQTTGNMPTMFATVVEWQRQLMQARQPLRGVDMSQIAIFKQAAVISVSGYL